LAEAHVATDAALIGHLIDCRNLLSSVSLQDEIMEHDRDLMMSLARKTNLFLPEGNQSRTEVTNGKA
jgi:hypothetical protein